MTLEQLQARKQVLLDDQAKQRELANEATAAIQEAQAKRQTALDYINALGGAIQDCDHWIAQMEKAHKLNGASLVRFPVSEDTRAEEHLS